MSEEQKQGLELLNKVSESYFKHDYKQAIKNANEFINTIDSEYSDIYVLRANCYEQLNKKNNALRDYYLAWHRKIPDYYHDYVDAKIVELSKKTIPVKNMRTIKDNGEVLMLSDSDTRVGKKGYDLNDLRLWIYICGLKNAENYLNKSSKFAEIKELNPIWDLLDTFYEMGAGIDKQSTILLGFDSDGFFLANEKTILEKKLKYPNTCLRLYDDF